jgi:hypothetical protein
MTYDESIAQRIADLQELEEARFLAIFIRQLRRPDINIGMIGILSPRDSRKGIRCSSMITDIRNIQASCTCIGWVHS